MQGDGIIDKSKRSRLTAEWSRLTAEGEGWFDCRTAEPTVRRWSRT